MNVAQNYKGPRLNIDNNNEQNIIWFSQKIFASKSKRDDVCGTQQTF